MLACLARAARLRWLQILVLFPTVAIVRSHSDTCDEHFPASLATTETTSTTIGVSLVQGLSLNRRVNSHGVRELLNEQGGTEDGQRHSGRRDLDSDVTGPKGQRDLHIAHAKKNGAGERGISVVDPEMMNEGFPHSTMRPSAVEPLLSAQPGSEDPDSTKILQPEPGVWGETLRKHLPSLLLQIPTFDSSMQAVRNMVQPTSESNKEVQIILDNPKKQASAGILVVLVLLIVLIILCWRVTRPEPIAFQKPPNWGQSAHAQQQYQQQQQRISVVPNRSPRGPSVPVGEPRQLASRTSPRMGSAPMVGHPHGGGRDRIDSSSDEWEGTTDGDVFCPDLVVPQQCECILVVPVYAPVGSFGIADMNGRSVLQAASQVQGQGLLWQLHLQTTTGESLARCIEVKPSSPGTLPSFHILDAKGKYFASLAQVQGQQRFELTTQNGFKLHLYGNFQTQAVNVTDENDSLLATTEPCGTDFDQTGIYYRLRVAPLANVGHSLCALLCIGQILRPRASISPGGAI